MSCETQSRPGSVLVQKSGRVGDDMRITALDPFYGKDGRRSRYVGEVLERYRGEDVWRYQKNGTWVSSGQVSMFSRRKFLKVIRRF